MPESAPVMPGAEPFFFEGNQVGCLLCHGFTGTTQSLRALGAVLAERGGFTVAGPRLTGHGTSVADLARASAEQWVRDVARAAAELRERCTKLFAIGLSMGGTLVLHLAGCRPDLVRGVVPINAALFSKNPELGALVFAEEAPARLPGIGSDICKPGGTELAYPEVPLVAVRQVLALMGAARELLPRVSCPALVIQSRQDHVVPPENGPFLLEHLGSKQKRLLWLEDSYHVATLDHDADRIAREALRFVEEHA